MTRQGSFNLGGLSEENWIRIQEQNEKPISVIIGNPPYNDQQSNWYEQNPNRQYTEVDRRIRDTYIREGTAQRTHQYDMYKRFIRWASDRLADDGIVAFITNRAYLEARQDDGFRQVAAAEFTDITSWTWVRTCGATRRFRAPPTTSSGYRPGWPSPSSCGTRPAWESAISNMPAARTLRLPGTSWLI